MKKIIISFLLLFVSSIIFSSQHELTQQEPLEKHVIIEGEYISILLLLNLSLTKGEPKNKAILDLLKTSGFRHETYYDPLILTHPLYKKMIREHHGLSTQEERQLNNTAEIIQQIKLLNAIFEIKDQDVFQLLKDGANPFLLKKVSPDRIQPHRISEEYRKKENGQDAPFFENIERIREHLRHFTKQKTEPTTIEQKINREKVLPTNCC